MFRLSICVPLMALVAFEAAAETVIVTDHSGRDVSFEVPVENVAVFPLPLASTFIAVDGGPERLGGINPLAQQVIMNSVLGEIFPEIADIDSSVVSRNFEPNIEALLVAAPDVVVQWAMREEDLVEPVSRVGLPIVTMGWADREMERDRIRLLGRILGQEERAEEFLKYETEIEQDIAAVLADVPVEDRARMIFIDTWDGNTFSLFGNNRHYFQAGGLRNIAFEEGMTGGRVPVGVEQIIEWNPEIIFLNYYDVSAETQEILDHPALQDVKAVREGRVYKTPALDPASQSGPLVYMWFANVGLPDIFQYDVRQAIMDRYEIMYGATISEEQVDSLLQWHTNGDRANYQALFGRYAG